MKRRNTLKPGFNSNEARFDEKTMLGQIIENPGPGSYLGTQFEEEVKLNLKPFLTGDNRFKRNRRSEFPLPGPG